MFTKTQQHLKNLTRVWDMVSDMVEGGRLTEADIPDDYQALVEGMVRCTFTFDSLPGDSMRVWVYHHGIGNDNQHTGSGLVRLTLHPGKPVDIFTGGATDEGYSRTETRYTWSTTDGVVYVETYTRSSDCDGPLETWDEGTVPVTWIPRGEEAIPVQWGKSSQRDHYAEAMGY